MSEIFELNEVLRDFTVRLENLDISYMLTGSLAMAYYAQPRMTADIDIIVEIDMTKADEFIKNFESDYYIPHGSMRSAISRNSMFNVLHEETLVKIDCVLRKVDEFQVKAFNRRKNVDFAGFNLWIISHEDLILSKLSWAKKTDSEMQLRDATNLLRGEIDLIYLRTWARKLAVDSRLNDILDALGKK